jgi:hypothetical protein
MHERYTDLWVASALFNDSIDEIFFNFDESVIDLVIVHQLFPNLSLGLVRLQLVLRVNNLRRQANFLKQLFLRFFRQVN